MSGAVYDPIDMHKKKSSTLVVHCSDPRFQDAYRKVTDSLGHYYDLLVFPGASKAIADHGMVVDNIKMLHGLHHFETIHIMDHVACGAFGEISDEIKAHSDYLEKAKTVLEKALSGITVSPHLLAEDGELNLSN
jgi:hypothetical protein